MITVGMDYQVVPGKQKQFEASFDAILEALRSADGHVASSMYRNIRDDGAYLIVSEWSDQEVFTAFIRSQAFKDVTTWGKEEILAGRPHHKVYKH